MDVTRTVPTAVVVVVVVVVDAHVTFAYAIHTWPFRNFCFHRSSIESIDGHTT